MSFPERQIYIFLTLNFFFFFVPSGASIFFFFLTSRKLYHMHEICDIWCCEMPDERYVIDVLV